MQATQTTSRPKPVRMQEVAEQAEVSIATVSRILSGRTGGDPGLRDHVLGVAERLGYRKLRRRDNGEAAVSGVANYVGCRTGNIAFLACSSMAEQTQDVSSRYYGMLASIHQHAKKLGLNVMLASEESGEKPSLPALIRDGQVDGVICASSFGRDFTTRLSKAVPTVMLNALVDWPPVSNILIDDRMLIFKAVEHLYQLGHRRIAMFYVKLPEEQLLQPQNYHLRKRIEAYHDALGYFGMEDDPDLCALEPFGEGQHPQAIACAMDKLLALKQPPTAIITTALYSMFVMQEALRRGISIPEDMSLLATDDHAIAGLQLTAFKSNLEVEPALELLLERIKNPKAPVTSLRVEPQLIQGQSTGPAKA